MLTFTFAMGCLSLIVGFCSLAATKRPNDEQAIREIDAAWSHALENRDLDKLMSNYSEDADFLSPDVPLIHGKEKIRERFAKRMALPGYSASFVPTKIVVSEAGDMAYEIGAFRATLNNEAGEPVVRAGKHLVTWGKSRGRWVVLAESLNFDAPQP